MSGNNATPSQTALRRFWSDIPARIGSCGVIVLLFIALFAPLLANGRPLLMQTGNNWSMPFLRHLFAPDSSESLVEKFFNYSALLPVTLWPILKFVKCKFCKYVIAAVTALLLLLPFIFTAPRLDKTDYRSLAEKTGQKALFAPIPYSPFEISGSSFEKPGKSHWLGCDDIGRDVAARLIYGARVSLAVGLLSTLITLLIGTAMGLATGYFRGWFDLLTMRIVEILLCFPTFLLLLIVMSLLSDHKFDQSIPLVIAVIGLTGWIGLTFLVRGEVLKQSALPYIQSCAVSGIPVSRILFRHLLPNILPPVLISFTFGVAGAILAESGLSFLGFGVQPPTASWGNLLRQAFDNPLAHWHLTLFPGIALFIAVISFNFIGEGLRRALTTESA